MAEVQNDNSSDIVVRDRNGEPLLQMPQVMMPTMTDEEQMPGGNNEDGPQGDKESTSKREYKGSL